MVRKILALVFFTVVSLQAKKDTFLVKSKNNYRLSKQALKEKIGETTRDLFHQTINLTSHLGRIQVGLSSSKSFVEKGEKKDNLKKHEWKQVVHKNMGVVQVRLSSLQRRFSQVLEKLLENAKPFKKADRGDLKNSYSLVQSIEKDLQNQMKSYQQFLVKVQKTDSDGKVMQQKAEKFAQSMQKIIEQVNKDECFKNA